MIFFSYGNNTIMYMFIPLISNQSAIADEQAVIYIVLIGICIAGIIGIIAAMYHMFD